MAELMHNLALRVNSDQFTADTFPIWAEVGWIAGPHPDTDPDDDSVVPRVLPAADPAVDDTGDAAAPVPTPRPSRTRRAAKPQELPAAPSADDNDPKTEKD